MRCLLAAVTLALLAPTLQAEIRFPSVIGDNMVLQRGEPVPVWGWDTAGTKVSVTIGETTVTATAGADGRCSDRDRVRAAADGFEHAIEIDFSAQGADAFERCFLFAQHASRPQRAREFGLMRVASTDPYVSAAISRDQRSEQAERARA